MKTSRLTCLAAMLILSAWNVLADDLQSVEARIVSRLPAVNELKVKQIVGENNQGYLEFVGDKQSADVVDAENADRKLVYGAIAAKTGAPIDQVSKQRAEEIRRQSKSGVMVQLPNGQWIEK